MTAGTGAVLVLWALAVGSGLRVETSTPDALCPDLGQVRAAARARLGDIEADGDWNASYALIHRPDGAEAGDVVRLELHDPAGRLRLQRELPRAGESCASLAQALVVILDAYFRHPTDAGRADRDACRRRRPRGSTRRSSAPAAPRPTVSSRICRRGGRAHGAAPIATARCSRWGCGWRWCRRSGGPGSRGAGSRRTQSQTVGTAVGERAQLRPARVRRARSRAAVAGAGLLVGPEVMLALDRADAAMLLDGRSPDARVVRRRPARAASAAAGASRCGCRCSRRSTTRPRAWGGTFLIARFAIERDRDLSAVARALDGGGGA